jgi:GT2 family glycosyltransferase
VSTVPGVSVLIATRNRIAWLQECIESVREQTYSDLEIVVSDDGSDDGSVEFVRATATQDPRIRLLTDNPRPGVFENFSHLLAHATGDAVCFIGDDDVLGPSFVEKLLGGLTERRAGVAYCMFDVIDGAGAQRPSQTARLDAFHEYQVTPPGLQVDPAMSALRGQLWLGGCLYRTKLVRELGFDPRAGSAADFDLALRISQVSEVWFVKERLWRYRDHHGAASRAQTAETWTTIADTLERHSFTSVDAEQRRLALLRTYRVRAAWSEVADAPGRARQILARYRAGGGRPDSPRHVVTLLVSCLPSPMRRRAVAAINRRQSAARGRLEAAEAVVARPDDVPYSG